MAGKPFEDLKILSPETLEVLHRGGFLRATPVQEATIPLFAGNKDVAVDACTGSGKTLAFVIPSIEKLRKLEEPLKKHQVGAVVVSPTRELSRQIFTVATPFVDSLPWLRAALLVGGSDPSVDVLQLKEGGAHFLVGTPGRLDDILQRCSGFLDLRTVEVLVLDEADRLLDMGFKAQLDSIMGRLPKQRRTGLFSATQTEAVEALARAGLRNPVRVNVAVTLTQQQQQQQQLSRKRKQSIGGEASAVQATEAEAVQRTPSTLTIQYVVCEASEKLPQLVAFLQEHKSEKAIVYFLTCACVDFFAAALPRLAAVRAAAPTYALHGRMKQAARESTLEKFTEAEAGVLLCTDVAARGLDIPDVHWILQLDPPQDPSAFVHRVGRTARMGRSGSALVFLLPHEATYVEFLKIRKVPLQKGRQLPMDAPAVLSAVRRESETDRLVMEAGTKAFVSYIRAYKEHHCKFIFRVQDLDLGDLARGFCLLRLPKMPEVKKGKGVDQFQPSPVDPDTVRFKDKGREKQRRAALKAKEAQRAQQAERAAQQKKAQQQAAAAAQGPGARLTAAKRRQLEARQELAELNDEYALLRKLKKGKISERVFDQATGLTSDDDHSDAQPSSAGGRGQAGDGEEGAQEQKAASSRKAKQQGGASARAAVPRNLGEKMGMPLSSRDLVGEALAKKQRRQRRKQQKQRDKGNKGG